MHVRCEVKKGLLEPGMVYEVWDRGANMLTSGGSAPGSGERTGTVCSLSAFSRAIGPRCTGEASEHIGC